MPFCCIAIVGVAMIYFVVLWIRQIFSGPARDIRHPALLQPPPRALSGNGPLPVYGHTPLFRRKGGNIALLFEPDWRELSFVPKAFSRPLGECFALFIWGQWRVAIKGEENASKFLGSQKLEDGWIWSPPDLLLGKSCPAILEQEDPEQAAELKRLLHRPLGQLSVVAFAPEFATCASRCLVQLQEDEKPIANKSSDSGEESQESGQETNYVDFKLKWEALRSYTLDIVDGPVLNLGYFKEPGSVSEVEGSDGIAGSNGAADRNNRVAKKDLPPTRERMLLLMERMKYGLDVIKSTFGPEWMYIWIWNEYGRAVNARMHVDRHISKHVAETEKAVPVSHKRGHAYYDPSTRTIPLLALKENFARSREGIFGDRLERRQSSHPDEDDIPHRQRANSLPSARFLMGDEQSKDMGVTEGSSLDVGLATSSRYMTPFETEQDLARPCYESPMRSPALAKKVGADASALLKLQPPPEASESPSLRQGRKEFAKKHEKHVQMVGIPFSGSDEEVNEKKNSTNKPTSKRSLQTVLTPDRSKARKKPKVMSLLELILRQQGPNKEGITQAVMAEISILLWMILDVGNAWTAMALHLIACDKDACEIIQDEIDSIEEEFGSSMFSPDALKKAKYVDALIYEAIRLTPPFLGGLKRTTETVGLPNEGVYVAKGSDVFFCQPSEQPFDLYRSLGKRPETLGKSYPSVELFGFLPFHGLEVPLMVLQTKVFLMTSMRDFCPFSSRRKTFIRRVRDAWVPPSVTKKHREEGLENVSNNGSCVLDVSDGYLSDGEAFSSWDIEAANSTSQGAITQNDATRLFTKVPFPEPKRVIRMRPRELVETTCTE